MTQIDTSLHRKIGRDWIKSVALVVICVACCAVFAWGTTIEPSGVQDYKLQNGAFLLLPVLAPFTLWVAYRLVSPLGALLLISPQGFTDRRVSAQTVPWTGIGNIVRRGEIISITLKRNILKTYRFSPSQRLIKWRYKTARPSHLLVATWCIKPCEPPLFDILTSYHNAHHAKPATA